VASSGPAVIEYVGKRGNRWRLKFLDSSGRQVMETPKEQKGWSKRDAERALGVRLKEVERDRWRKTERLSFAAFASRFEAEVLPGRNLKPTTLADYKSILHGHLTPFFDQQELASIEAAGRCVHRRQDESRTVAEVDLKPAQPPRPTVQNGEAVAAPRPQPGRGCRSAPRRLHRDEHPHRSRDSAAAHRLPPA
jgi:hypothetical protein